LINNAYYTVHEKKRIKQNGYEPTVTVDYCKDNGKVKIKVRDNGNGIPPKILDKIFHHSSLQSQQDKARGWVYPWPMTL
jgi:nitrogen fixation/metabolism regulation signal transduction histidine kinase